MRFLLITLSLLFSGCATNQALLNNEQNELRKFAYANCVMWYLESKGYDTADVRAISGGIVEKSDISLDRFQEIALLVKEYNPDIETKNDIDINILKCFYLEDSAKIRRILNN